MSEFSSLTTKLVTPPMKRRGFTKRGAFSQSSTHDSAFYIRGDIELRLTFSFHPYDHPEMGIRMLVRDANGIRFDRLYPPVEGGTEAILRCILVDLDPAIGDA